MAAGGGGDMREPLLVTRNPSSSNTHPNNNNSQSSQPGSGGPASPSDQLSNGGLNSGGSKGGLLLGKKGVERGGGGGGGNGGNQRHLRTLFVACVLTACTSSQGLLTAASKTGNEYKYNYATVPLLAEIIKFIACAVLLSRQVAREPGTQITYDWRSVRLYPIPSLIYLVHNNVQFMTLQYVDPSTYQILGNLKIVTTGILFRLILKRRLSRVQWMALLLLTIGATTSQISSSPGRALAAPWEGYVLGLASAWLSALAGVYTEYLMKRNDDTLYWQNMQLYGFGVVFNALRLCYDDIQAGFSNGFWLTSMFNGYDVYTWLVVLNLSFTGLVVSWVMKYADNIVKVFATSMAMLLTMLLSVAFFGVEPTLQLSLGIIIGIMSLQLYFTPPKDLVSTEEPLWLGNLSGHDKVLPISVAEKDRK